MSLLYASTCFEHYVLIIRRSKLYYTSSGIITPIGGRPVRRLREDILSSFRIIVCYTSSTNERNSSSLTDNLKQSVQKVEFLKDNFHEFLGAFAKPFKSDY